MGRWEGCGGRGCECADQYAEQAVWAAEYLSRAGNPGCKRFDQLAEQLPISGDSGIAAALNSLYQSFSAWGQTPDDNNARKTF